MLNKRYCLGLVIRLKRIEWYSSWIGTIIIMLCAIAMIKDSRIIVSDKCILFVILATHLPSVFAWWYSNSLLKRLKRQIAMDIPIGRMQRFDTDHRTILGRYDDAIRITILILSSATISLIKLKVVYF